MNKIKLFFSIKNTQNIFFATVVFICSMFAVIEASASSNSNSTNSSFSSSSSSNSNKSNEILRAMQDEMQRTMQNLKLEDLQKPYFLEYILRTRQDFFVESSLGAIIRSSDGTNKNSYLTVRVRVGNYKFDNTNFTNISKDFFGSTTDDDKERYIERSVPIDLDYESLRRELWLATDAAYKDAAEAYAGKESAIKNIIRKDTTWDFSPVDISDSKTTKIDTIIIPKINIEKFENLAKAASSIFLDYPDIMNSYSTVGFATEYIYYLNSEETKYIRNSGTSEINISAVTQTKDGSPIYNYYNFIGISPEDFPSEDSLHTASKNVANKIISSMNSNILEDSYSGPIIFSGQAACEVLAQTFAPNLVAQKEASNFGAGWEISYSDGIYGNTKVFQNKIGARVLPDFLSLEDLPNLKKFQDITLLGHYDFDDDGVKSQDLLLVDKGYLKTLLSDRVPTKKINISNGHRRNWTITYSNLKLTASKNKQKSEKELESEMLKLCKKRNLPYGIIIRKITNKSVFNSKIYALAHELFSYNMRKTVLPIEVYKIYLDGRQELVRDVELSGLTAQVFKEILQVGNKYNIYNFTAAAANWNSNDVNSTIIAPDLLFEDCELRVVDKNNKKLPILKNPLNEK